jgi:hypothetical protein
MKRWTFVLPFLLTSSLLAACGGGGSSAGAPAAPGNASANGGTQGAQVMGVTFSGANALGAQRNAQSLSGTSITAKLNGTVVGTGTLDSNGHAAITFTSSVPRGSTLVVTAGTTTITVVLARNLPATTVMVTVNAGVLNVQISGDPTGTGNANPSMADNDAENMDEDNNGNFIDIDNPMATMLPANLPITVVAACNGIVITPTGTGIASIRVREQTDDQNNDDDSNAKLDFRGAFTGPLTFPIVAAAARLRIEVFGQPSEQGPRIVEIRVPISAVTMGMTAPSPCPSPAASASPTVAPSPTATHT